MGDGAAGAAAEPPDGSTAPQGEAGAQPASHTTPAGPTVPVHGRGSAPFPSRWRRGSLAFGSGSLRFQARSWLRPAPPVHGRAGAVRLESTRGTTAREVARLDRSCVVFVLRWHGQRTELAVLPRHLAAFRSLLRAAAVAETGEEP